MRLAHGKTCRWCRRSVGTRGEVFFERLDSLKRIFQRFSVIVRNGWLATDAVVLTCGVALGGPEVCYS